GEHSGRINATATDSILSSIIVGGSIISRGEGAGIFSTGAIGTLTVTGDLLGDTTPVSIVAQGDIAVALAANAINKITVNGSVKNAEILAGYDEDLNAVNGDVKLGKVIVNGDFVASDI